MQEKILRVRATLLLLKNKFAKKLFIRELRGYEMSINFISINPDTRSLSGHFFFYDFNITEICSRYDINFYSLCWKQTPNKLIEKKHQFIPTFSDHSWSIGNKGISGPPESVLSLFTREIQDAIGEITNYNDEKIFLYMYTGSLHHAEVIAEVVWRQKNVMANINLFWLPFIDVTSAEFKRRWATFLKLLKSSSKLKVTVTTSEMQELLYRALNVKIALAPHPCTLFSDRDFVNLKIDKLLTGNLNDSRKVQIVLFPGRAGAQVQIAIDKGYFITVDVVKKLAASKDMFCKFIMRKPNPSNSRAKLAVKEVEELAEFFNDELPEDDFAQLLKSADIIVLPYSQASFSHRTSGLFIDAIYLGKPLVSLKGTWMGNRIEEFGCGAVATAHNASSFAKAINEVAKNYRTYQKNTIKAGAEWFQSNSWMSLFGSLLQPIN